MDLKEFVKTYENISPDKLRLKFLNNNLSSEERDFFNLAIMQIAARKKFAAKFRRLLKDFPDFLFPSMLAGEQASHEAVATYHASLCEGVTSLLDMSAGLGIDFLTMASAISANCNSQMSDKTSEDLYIAVEMDSDKADILRSNLELLNIEKSKVVCGDSLRILQDIDAHHANHSEVDADRLIFVDPARRGEGDRRLYDPADCSPDIITNWNLLRRNARTIIVKNSPMLDPVRACTLFPGITEIHIVSFKNECKEVLIITDTQNQSFDNCKTADSVPYPPDGLSQSNDDPSFALRKIVCVNIDGIEDAAIYEINAVDFIRPAAETIISGEIPSGWYIYEPNASLMKVISRSNLCRAYRGLQKLSPNCHLYASHKLNPDFPGRIMKFNGIISKGERKSLKGCPFNVATRNYPESAEKLKKSLKVNSATSNREFIFGATLGEDERPVLIKCTAIQTVP